MSLPKKALHNDIHGATPSAGKITDVNDISVGNPCDMFTKTAKDFSRNIYDTDLLLETENY